MSMLIELGAAAAALIAIISLFSMLVRYAVVKPIKSYIDKMTYPIQPHANGGRCLPDLVSGIDDLKIMLVGHIKNHDTP